MINHYVSIFGLVLKLVSEIFFNQRIILVDYNLGRIFTFLVISLIRYDNIMLTKLIAEN